MPSPTASTGAASSPARRWSAARSSPHPPTSCSAPRRPTRRCAAAWARAAPAGRCAATATPSSAARSTAPTPARPGRSSAGGGRPTARASAAARPATTWTATSRAASCGCGGGGICSGSCNGTPCGCGSGPLRPPQGRAARRSATATAATTTPASARSSAGSSPAPPPWQIEPSCSSQRGAHRQQHPLAQPAVPPGRAAADLPGRRRLERRPASAGIGFYDNRNGRWTLRQTRPTSARCPRSPTAGKPATCRSSATGTATARDSVGIFRDGEWHLTQHGSYPPATTVAGPQVRACGRRHPGRRRLERRRHRRHRASSARRLLAPEPQRRPIRPRTFYVVPLRQAGRRHPRRRRLERRRRRRRRHLPQRHVVPLRHTSRPVATVHRDPLRRAPATSPSSATGTASAAYSIGVYRPSEGTLVPAARRSTTRSPITRHASASQVDGGLTLMAAIVVALALVARPARRARGRAAPLARRDPAGPPRPRA